MFLINKKTKKCVISFLEKGRTLMFAPDCNKNKKKCVITLLIVMLMYQNLSLIAVRLKDV